MALRVDSMAYPWFIYTKLFPFRLNPLLSLLFSKMHPMVRSWLLATLICFLEYNCALGEMAAPTIGAHEEVPMMSEPTAAPPRELVKARLQQRATATTAVYCDEWNIAGGMFFRFLSACRIGFNIDQEVDYGRPKCYPGYTCLFTQIGGKGYEGCGKQGVAYNWITGTWYRQ